MSRSGVETMPTSHLVILCLTAVLVSGIAAWTFTKNREIDTIKLLEHDKERPRKFWEKEPKAEEPEAK